MFFSLTSKLHRAIDRGDLASIADLAWLLLHGREGISVDTAAAFKLAQEGSSRGCPHSQGVLALCYTSKEWYPMARSVENAATARRLASCSAEAGSKYGQFALGCILQLENNLVFGENWTPDAATALCKVQYALAAAQGLDIAQVYLGMAVGLDSIESGGGAGEACRLFLLAAAQGSWHAFFLLRQLPFDKAEQNYWLERSRATRSHPSTTTLSSRRSLSGRE